MKDSLKFYAGAFPDLGCNRLPAIRKSTKKMKTKAKKRVCFSEDLEEESRKKPRCGADWDGEVTGDEAALSPAEVAPSAENAEPAAIKSPAELMAKPAKSPDVHEHVATLVQAPSSLACKKDPNDSARRVMLPVKPKAKKMSEKRKKRKEAAEKAAEIAALAKDAEIADLKKSFRSLARAWQFRSNDPFKLRLRWT